MKITIRSVRFGKYGNETELYGLGNYKEIELANLENELAGLPVEEPWIAILSGGKKFSTLISSDANGRLVFEHTEIK